MSSVFPSYERKIVDEVLRFMLRRNQPATSKRQAELQRRDIQVCCDIIARILSGESIEVFDVVQRLAPEGRRDLLVSSPNFCKYTISPKSSLP